MDLATPLELYTDTVRPEWIDYNGHMNVAYFVLAFDYATDAFLEFLGMSAELRAERQVSTFGQGHDIIARSAVSEKRLRESVFLQRGTFLAVLLTRQPVRTEQVGIFIKTEINFLFAASTP